MDKEHESLQETYPCWEDEIDLRELLETLLRWWWLIVTVTLAAAIGAFVFSSLKPPKYQSRMSVTVANSRYVKVLSKVATDGETVREVGTELKGVLDISPAELSQMMSARADTAGSAVDLTVTARDPAIASKVLGVWSQVFVKRATQKLLVLNGASDEDLSSLQKEVSKARQDLIRKEQALLDYQSKNGEFLKKRSDVDMLRQEMSDYRMQLRWIDQVMAEIGSLRGTLSKLPPEEKVSPANAALVQSVVVDSAAIPLSSANAESRDYFGLGDVGGARSGTASVNASQSVSVYFVTPPSISLPVLQKGSSNKAALDLLDSLSQAMRDRKAAVAANLEKARGRYLKLSAELLTGDHQEGELEGAIELQREKVASLQKELSRVSTLRNRLLTGVQLESSVPPATRVPVHRWLNTALAAVVGFMLAVFAVFAIEWWRGEKDEP